MNENYPKCATCPYVPGKRICIDKQGKGPEGCPTLEQEILSEQALKELEDAELLRFARQSSIQESQGYTARDQGYANIRPIKPRIQEIIEFAGKMDYQRLGLAFCLGLRHEAKVVQEILSTNRFEVVSVACKAARVPKEVLGLGQEHQVDMTSDQETMCNPIFQAYVLNRCQTQLNILLGLCVGHDSLFLKYAQAYCTVLAVKDRLMGHNPLAAVYTYDSYFCCLKSPLE